MYRVPNKVLQDVRKLVRFRLFLNEIGLSKHSFSVNELKEFLEKNKA